ncbi:MAG: toxin-antitoxin system HicB family antitoxin [Thermus sp.]|nr:toxin-antitoxin system HicB family antitoxin [Thermus sp.]
MMRRAHQRKTRLAGQRHSLEYYLNLKYPVLLVPEPEGGYTALIPDLPGCVSVGETPEETLANVEEARTLWLEAAYEYGDEIPLPSTEREYSGRVLLRMPKSLHRRLAEEAEREGVSLNQYMVSLLAERSALKAVSDTLLGRLASLLKERGNLPSKGMSTVT